jgi:hypothetical protein
LGRPTGDYRIIPAIEAVDKAGVGLIRAGGESETVVDGGVGFGEQDAVSVVAAGV